MAKISLAGYSITIRKKHSKEILPWNGFNGADSLDVLFRKYIERWSNYTSDNDKKVIINLKKAFSDDSKFYGIIETGEWGFESTLVDIDTKEVSYNRKATEAEMLPFFFVIGYPNKHKEGILILERFGTLGIRKALGDFINTEFQKENPEYIIDFNSLVMEEVADSYLREGRILKIHFISHKIPSDICDLVANGSEDSIAFSEYVVHAKKKSFLPINADVIKMLGKGSRQRRVLELREFEFDSIKIKVERDGFTRTFDIEQVDKMRSYVNIDDKIDKDNTGHPTLETIKVEAFNLYAELERRLSL